MFIKINLYQKIYETYHYFLHDNNIIHYISNISRDNNNNFIHYISNISHDNNITANSK